MLLHTKNYSFMCSWYAQQTSPSSLSFTNLEGRKMPRKAPMPPYDLQNLHRRNSSALAATLKSTCFFLKTELAVMLWFFLKCYGSMQRSYCMLSIVLPGLRMRRKSISPCVSFSGRGMYGSSFMQMGEMMWVIYAVIWSYYCGVSGSVSSNALPPISFILYIFLYAALTMQKHREIEDILDLQCRDLSKRSEYYNNPMRKIQQSLARDLHAYAKTAPGYQKDKKRSEFTFIRIAAHILFE